MKYFAFRSPQWFALLLVLTLLSSCGGGGGGSQTGVSYVGSQQGVTPFISFVRLYSINLGSAVSARYTIEPKPGSASKPVGVQYSIDALARRGYVDAASGIMTLPVFGLYAGYSNSVSVQIQFQDNSTNDIRVSIATASYTDPNSIYDRPSILARRAAGSVLGFDFFFMKSALGSPVVVDTDGEIRWASTGVPNGFASIFQDNGFVICDITSPTIRRLELDGSIGSAPIDAPAYTMCHHNIDPGKQGLLAEVNTRTGGVTNLESMLSELDSSGAVLNEWDFASLLGNYMRSQGDDPGTFVRPGVDWFHMNAATYDPQDDSVIVSSRENFVIKVDYTSGDIIWILGDPTKYWYTFPSLRARSLQLAAGGLYPIGQHATSITSDGLLMLFNDGYASLNQPAGAPAGASRTYSAVSAYAIDPVTLTAQEVWHFDYGQTIYSAICSSAYEASGSSLLVDYAYASGGTKARLVGLDAGHNVIFDFEYPNAGCNTSWNAQPIQFENLSFN